MKAILHKISGDSQSPWSPPRFRALKIWKCLMYCLADKGLSIGICWVCTGCIVEHCVFILTNFVGCQNIIFWLLVFPATVFMVESLYLSSVGWSPCLMATLLDTSHPSWRKTRTVFRDKIPVKDIWYDMKLHSLLVQRATVTPRWSMCWNPQCTLSPTPDTAASSTGPNRWRQEPRNKILRQMPVCVRLGPVLFMRGN